jgi:hypothetical protein
MITQIVAVVSMNVRVRNNQKPHHMMLTAKEIKSLIFYFQLLL